MQSHVRIRSGLNTLGCLIQFAGIIHLGVIMEVILQEAQNLANLGGEVLLVLPEQDAVESHVCADDIGSITENLALVLVE